MNNSSVKPPTVMVENIIIWLNSTTRIAPLSNLKLVVDNMTNYNTNKS